MANHRPKSLSELNQVYDKALKAQRAIQEGSRSLTPDEVPAPVQEPTQSIFDELSKQAAQTKKTEIYDSEIADIANDFLKRYAKPEQHKTPSAPKELKRPAPSIQSLYHTPVKAVEEPADDIPMNLQSDFAFSDTAATTQNIPAVKPKTPEELMQEMTQRIILPLEEPEEDAAPEEITEAPEAPAQPDIHTTPAQPYVAPSVITPAARMSSEERSDLIKEYLRVMSDDDDDEYFDDDDEYSKPKKGGLWSRLTKRRQIVEDETPAEDNETAQNESEDEDYNDDAHLSTDVYSSYGEDQDEYPQEEEKTEEAPVSEDVPMSLYDYLEADFDYAEDAQDDVLTQEEDSYEEEYEPEEYEEIPEEAFGEEAVQEEAVIAPEEELPTEELQEEPEEFTEEPIEIPEETEEVLPEEEPEEIIPEEESEEIEAEEEIIIPEEELEPTEEIIPTEEEPVQEEEPQAEEIADDSPTAGMVFDDIFSVSDENKRSYTGGDWSTSPQETTTAQEDMPEDEPQEYDEASEEIIRPEKAARPKKKISLASKIMLSLLIVILTVCTALVSVIGSVIAVNTGKLISDRYRVFSAAQDFSLSGVYAGDLVITEDLDQSIAQGDSFVYVNYDTHEFMVGKHSGSTYNITGETLLIAENEAGRVLVLVEDTLGSVKTIYKGLGSILGPISKNYILIDAVLLVLILAVLLILIVPGLKKDGKNSHNSPRQEIDQEEQEPVLYSEEPSYENYDDDENEEEDEFDPYDYDTDDIEEGLFSGI